MIRILSAGFLLAMVSPIWALDLILPDTAYQGDMIVGRVVPSADVWTGGKALTVSTAGYFVIGLPRDQENDAVVLARQGDSQKKRTIRILARKWRIERINGLPKKKVSLDQAALRRIKADAQRVNAVRASPPDPVGMFLEKGFTLPVEGRVSGVFGSQRILNDKPRSPHRGLDIAAPTGTPVLSPADGIVRLVADDMYLMGNTMMVDHGLGVRSIFIHLDRILAKKGDRVTQGDLIARVGQSGRATGPHLHWGVFVGTVAVDPEKVVTE
jgi:murein DD-endopeptidase MepM/ murein hydrolase activator NlpD